MKEIYSPDYVETLFNKMSDSYARVNLISSFGFSERWRKKCVELAQIEDGSTVVDLMSGMGECWSYVFNSANINRLIALDFSSEMMKRAKKRKQKLNTSSIELFQEDLFNNSIPTAVADHVICSFGLKTFHTEQLEQLVAETYRILKPNGQFSFVEISIPQHRLLQFFYLFYLKQIIPIIGLLFLGNPSTYKMLGIYTAKFQNASKMLSMFQKYRCETEYVKLFYGCATVVKGIKR